MINFYEERFDGEVLAKKIYEERPGIVVLKDILKPDACKNLLDEIQSKSHLLKKADERLRRAEQRFLKYYFGKAETGSNENLDFPLVSHAAKEYDTLTKDLVRQAGLSQKSISSVGIHRYCEDDKPGIDPHRDISSVQLVAVLVLEGHSPFYTADDYELTINKQTFDIEPRSLILMRGPRNTLERNLTKQNQEYDPMKDPRPIHCLGPIKKERIALLFRHIDELVKQ